MSKPLPVSSYDKGCTRGPVPHGGAAMKKRLTIIRYQDERCCICGGKLAVNDGAVRLGERDEWGVMRPKFAHPHCDNPDEDNFTVAPTPPLGRAYSAIHPDDETAERPSLARHIKR